MMIKGSLLPRGLLLLLIWMVIGLVLRLHHLSLKPLWADECSTLVFSLGQSFRTVPLNQLISAETLLAPLQWTPLTTSVDVVQQLLTESNHPPLYFALTHQWLDGWRSLTAFKSALGLSSSLQSSTVLWEARSLSVLCGVLGIPAIYGVTRWIWRSPRTAHVAAILMALSPFGIYLAQEARHYTLTLIWIIASLACLVAVVRCLWDQRPIPPWLAISWISVNGLGLATHYFFILTLLAEGVTLAIMGMLMTVGRSHTWKSLFLKSSFFTLLPLISRLFKSRVFKPAGKPDPFVWSQNRWRLTVITLGTAASGVVWVPFLLAIQQGDELTRWIQDAPTGGWSWLNPISHTIASVVSMVMLLPVQGVRDGVAIAFALILVVATVGLVKLIAHTIRRLGKDASRSNERLSLAVIGGFIVSAIAIMALITYGLGMDISQAFRYHFVYFPAVILLVAWGLGQQWHSSRALVLVILGIALCGSLTVSSNLGYQKLHRPDRVVREMVKRSHHPLVVSISHQSHGQTGRLMSIAHEMQRRPDEPILASPQFFLDHQPCDRPGEQNCNTPSLSLRRTLERLNAPYDLWLINYIGRTDLTPQQCTYKKTKRFDGYKAQHYDCSSEQ